MTQEQGESLHSLIKQVGFADTINVLIHYLEEGETEHKRVYAETKNKAHFYQGICCHNTVALLVQHVGASEANSLLGIPLEEE